MVAKGTKASSRHVKSWRLSVHCSEVTATPNCPVFHLVKEKNGQFSPLGAKWNCTQILPNKSYLKCYCKTSWKTFQKLLENCP